MANALCSFLSQALPSFWLNNLSPDAGFADKRWKKMPKFFPPKQVLLGGGKGVPIFNFFFAEFEGRERSSPRPPLKEIRFRFFFGVDPHQWLLMAANGR